MLIDSHSQDTILYYHFIGLQILVILASVLAQDLEKVKEDEEKLHRNVIKSRRDLTRANQSLYHISSRYINKISTSLSTVISTSITCIIHIIISLISLDQMCVRIIVKINIHIL